MRNVLIISALLFLSSLHGQKLPNDYLKARALMLHEEYDSALVYLNNYIDIKPSYTEARLQRGNCYYKLKQYDKAISEYLIVNSQRSDLGSFMLAKSEAKLNHEELAIKYLREHLTSSNKLAEKDILLDEDFSKVANSDLWKSLWKEKDWYNTYERDFQNATYLKSNEKYLEAINILNMLQDQGYKRSLVNQNLAEIYLASGNKKAAKAAIDLSFKSDSRNTAALKLRIGILNSEEEYEKAKLDCDRLLRQAPDEFDYYLIAGRINSKLGEYESAIERVNFYLELFPKSSEAYNELGEIHYEKGKYLNALTAFNHTLDLEKSNSVYYFNRGLTYVATKTYKYAARDFSMSLDLNPLDPEAWFQKGISEEALGNTDKACFDYKKAFQYGKFEAKESIERICGK